MGLETGSFISDLVTTNPVSGDNQSQGDDHLRLLKTLLKATFPNASKAFYFPDTASKSANYTVVATDLNKTFLTTTTSGSVTYTLPTLASGDAGWECFFIKVTTDTNPMFIAPASGTIQSGEYSGLAKTRRCIPGRKTRVFWTGTAWIAERVVNQPIGSFIDFGIDSTPVGYELAYGQTLSSASTNYPDYYAANGNSGVVLDMRGVVAAGQDDMGGTSKKLLTGVTGSVNGDTFGAIGGEETHILTVGEIAKHTHTGTTNNPSTNPAIASGYRMNNNNRSDTPSGGAGLYGDTTVEPTLPNHVHAFTTDVMSSGDDAHNNVQPTIIVNRLVVVE